MLSVAVGVAIGFAVGAITMRAAIAQRRAADPDARAILGLLYELYYLARADGCAALDAQAASWQTSPVFRRFPSIGDDEVVRAFIVDALRLLVDKPADETLDRELTAAMRALRRRDVAPRSTRTIECIRRSVLSMSRGVPVRSAAPDAPRGPGNLTRALARLARPIERSVRPPS